MHQVRIGVNVLSICLLLGLGGLINALHFDQSLLALLLVENYHSEDIAVFVEYGKEDVGIHWKLDISYGYEEDGREA